MPRREREFMASNQDLPGAAETGSHACRARAHQNDAVQGAIGIVVPFAPPSERAGVLSVIFVVSYLAMGAPAVVAGYLVAQGGNITTTAREFGATVMVLAALALLGALRIRP
jgi:hypothetical protein